MIRSVTMSLALSASAVAAAPLGSHHGIKLHGCQQDEIARFDPGPASPGPLRLAAIACPDFGSSPFTVTDPILSPNGTAVARWHGGAPAPIEIVGIERPGRIDIPNQVTFRGFAFLSSPIGGSPDALAWSSDSRTLWSVRQQLSTPGGWARGGLEPVAIGRDGAVRALPPLSHPAGPLDGLQWVGGGGRALAVFGAKGDYYRPRHDDPEPTLAMVDAAHGRLLASIPARQIPELARRLDGRSLIIAGATATILGDGRIAALIQFGRWAERPRGADPNSEPVMHPPLWLLWTEGEAPRVRPSPYPGERFTHLTLTPDGTRLFAIRELQPDGIRIECRAPPCPPAPPPTPVTGPIAELLDMSSGRVLWRLRLRVDRFWNQYGTVAISGDGRYALIPLPPQGDRNPVALVDMRRGRIVQTVSPGHVGAGRYALGFTADGRHAWVNSGYMLFYRLRRR